MSHQDLCRDSGSKTHASELYHMFRWLVADHCFENLSCRNDCSWSPRSLAFAALLWTWSDYSRLGDRFEHALQVLQMVSRSSRAPRVSYQAFMKLLARWTPPLLDSMLTAYRPKI